MPVQRHWYNYKEAHYRWTWDVARGIQLTHGGRDKMDAISQTTLNCIFWNKNVWIPIKISLKFVPKGLINSIPTLVQIMAWRRPGDKPLSEPMMVNLLTHICVTRPQWVNVESPWSKMQYGVTSPQWDNCTAYVCPEVRIQVPRQVLPSSEGLVPGWQMQPSRLPVAAESVEDLSGHRWQTSLFNPSLYWPETQATFGKT